MKVPVGTKVICPVCEKEFIKERNAQKYCSAKCRIIYNRTRPGHEPRNFICAKCGEEFASHKKKKYCSKECRLAANGRGKGKRTRKKKNILSIEQVAVLSREAGLSYGEYVAKYLPYDKEA